MVPAIAAILCMLALGFVTKYSGMDAVLGLAFTRTGPLLYPIFGTLLGWLGVALTGSDTSSNVLFGNLQKITAQKLGLDPILMASANTTGGVMGKMIDAQSIVVAAAATGEGGHEGELLRAVFGTASCWRSSSARSSGSTPTSRRESWSRPRRTGECLFRMAGSGEDEAPSGASISTSGREKPVQFACRHKKSDITAKYSLKQSDDLTESLPLPPGRGHNH